MDYITRKSCAKQYGAVGTWLGGSRYPRLGAIGIRVPLQDTKSARLDRHEVTEAFSDLWLMHLLPQHGGLRPAEIEEALAEAGTPEELKQRARNFLIGLANKSLVEQGRGSKYMEKIPTPPKACGKNSRKRTLLPKYKKLMAEKPGDDVQAALNEIRGEDPGVSLANSAPANSTPPDEAPRVTNTHELADFAEAELAKTGAALPLSPPKGYPSWLDYAVATMDTRALALDLVWEDSPWPDDTTRDQMYEAARVELAQLRRDNERNQPT